jgi:hypothetical protein
VGREDDGASPLPQPFRKIAPELFGKRRLQAGERFIKEKELWLRNDGACEPKTAALSA